MMLVVDGYLMKMGIKPIDVKFCEKCGKSPEDFSSRKTFLKHLKNNDHMSNEAFKCGQCEKSRMDLEHTGNDNTKRFLSIVNIARRNSPGRMP